MQKSFPRWIFCERYTKHAVASAWLTESSQGGNPRTLNANQARAARRNLQISPKEQDAASQKTRNQMRCKKHAESLSPRRQSRSQKPKGKLHHIQ